MDQRTCRLVTLGCKVNQYETQLVKETLERNGYREAAEDEPADLCVVNTCTVTNNGDSRSRQVIRQLAKQNPQSRTLVMGCYATRDPAAVRKLPGVFEVVTDKRELPDILARHGLYDMPAGISRFPGRKRAYVKVQDGCILRCSYCIIPQVRPNLLSRPVEEIEAEVRRLLAHGHQEIVLTGVHVGHYGVDSSRGKSGRAPFRLSHLIAYLDRIPGNWRMRLSSIEAAEVTDDLIDVARHSEHLCPHFHPALQSGSTAVLRRMRRRYTAERFAETLQKMRDRLQAPTFSTDVIVGFPGETEEEFAETLAFCERMGFIKVHVFPFSPRRGTPAATMPGQLPGTEIARRAQILEVMERRVAERYYQSQVGERVEVIVEGLCEDQPGFVHGTDRRYLPVMIPGTAGDLGRLVIGKGLRVTRDFLIAERGDADHVSRRISSHVSGG